MLLDMALNFEAQPLRNRSVAKAVRSKTYCRLRAGAKTFLHMHNQSTAGVSAITLVIPQGIYFKIA